MPGVHTVTAALLTAIVAVTAACGGTSPAPTGTSDRAATTTTDGPPADEGDGGRTDTSASASGQLLPGPDDVAYQELSALIGPDHAIAVAALTGDPAPSLSVATLGPLATAVAWSTIKVPMAMAVIEEGGGVSHADDIQRALTASDNDAAMRLWQFLGGGAPAAEAVTARLRAAGDRRTTIESQEVYRPYSPYGQTRWALADQARFALRMRCSAAGPPVDAAMREVVADQRWGLGTVGPDVAFKGGWGPGTEPGVAGSYLVRQFGVLTIDGRDVGVAIASKPADGTFDGGTRDLTAITTWLSDNLAPEAIGSGDPCEAEVEPGG